MEFAKLHGTGNDFIVIEGSSVNADWSQLAVSMCDRHFGVGADGLIVAGPSARADVRMRIFNADGSEAEMSGNGLRCLAKFVADRGIVTPAGDRMDVETGQGVLRVTLTTSPRRGVTSVRESMGRPRLDPREIPVAIEAQAPVRTMELALDGQTLTCTPVSMGNPHAVHFQGAPVSEYALHEIGPLVEHHPLFPNRTNLEVVRVLSRDRAEMRVWERGVGETLSCGTGASAVMVAGRLRDLVDEKLHLAVPGGELTLEWDGEGEVILTGPVEEVFTGRWPD